MTRRTNPSAPPLTRAPRVLSAAALLLAFITVCPDARAQPSRGHLLRFSADPPVDVSSTELVAPDGTRTVLCADAPSSTTCSTTSWYVGPGDYTLEWPSGDERPASSVSIHATDDRRAFDVVAEAGRMDVQIFILARATWGPRIERAPSAMRTAACAYVVRNHSEEDAPVPVEEGAVVAWVTERGGVDPDWLARVRRGRGTAGVIGPGERRCLHVLPERAAAHATPGRLAVYVATGTLADGIGYRTVSFPYWVIEAALPAR